MNTLRQTTVKANISNIINGKFTKKEGLEPSYVLTNRGQRISRVKFVGTIVDKFMSEDGNYSSVTVNDDSGSIRIKAFRDNVNTFDNLEMGNLVLVIGKIREYAEEHYVIPDIVKKVADPNYESFHRLQVLKQILKQKKILEAVNKEKENFADMEALKNFIVKKYRADSQTVEGIIETITEEERAKEKDFKPLVLETIDNMDEGDGVEMIKLLEESKLPENVFEEVMNELLSEGICFEPNPGIIKKA